MKGTKLYLKILSAFFLIIVLGIIVITPIVSENNIKEPSFTKVKMLERKPVYIGAWVAGFWDNETKTLNTQVQKDFEAKIDKKLALANIYADWEYLADPRLISDLNSISSNGWTPIISSNPSFFERCEDGDLSLYKKIASGECDEFLKSIGANLKAYQKPVFLRFAWEMNLPDMYWSVERVNSTPDDFVQAWRRFHKIVRQQGANNVIWVLSFNTSHAKTTPYTKLYPGDEYVDWTAIDGYNWGSAQPWGGWASFSGVFRKSYNELLAVSNKPVMLSEVNSAPVGGNKTEWLRDMLEKQIPKHYTKVQAIVFFNESKMEGENVDWRIEKSPDYVKAVHESLENEIYRSKYP